MPRVDEVEPFNIVSIPEESAVLTGVIGDGSCFLHSIVTDISFDSFTQLSKDEREKYIADTRSFLAQQMTIEEWKSLSNGEIAVLSLAECLGEKLRGKQAKFLETLADVMKINKDKSYLDITKLDPSIIKSAEICEREAFEKFVKDLGNPRFWINNLYIEYLSKKFNVNVIFIKSNGEQYVISKEDCREMLRDKSKSFIMIHYIDGAHFESIGLTRGGKIERVFAPDDPAITKILSTCVDVKSETYKEYITQFFLDNLIDIEDGALNKLVKMISALEEKFKHPELMTDEWEGYYRETIVKQFYLDKDPKQPFLKLYGKNFGNVMQYGVNDLLELLRNAARDYNKGVVDINTIRRFLLINDEYKALLKGFKV